MTNPMSLDGRTIIVTGAGQGIGQATSTMAIDLGAKVIGVDLNADGLSATADSHPDSFVPVVGSVADPKVAAQAVDTALTRFGAVHGLVNNAGITRPAMIEKMTVDQFTQVYEVHVVGSFHMTQAVGRHMLERARDGDKAPGAIVNISSDAGRRGSLGQVNYSSAKSALFGMTMSTAREWAKYGIRANAVCFGMVETAMTETIRTNDSFRETYLAQIPMGRWAAPEEVCGPVLFLLSDVASYVTGQILSVNGGYTIAV
jgi:3-oxoacyl-[acyl-carrier protein] reductase